MNTVKYIALLLGMLALWSCDPDDERFPPVDPEVVIDDPHLFLWTENGTHTFADSLGFYESRVAVYTTHGNPGFPYEHLSFVIDNDEEAALKTYSILLIDDLIVSDLDLNFKNYPVEEGEFTIDKITPIDEKSQYIEGGFYFILKDSITGISHDYEGDFKILDWWW